MSRRSHGLRPPSAGGRGRLPDALPAYSFDVSDTVALRRTYSPTATKWMSTPNGGPGKNGIAVIGNAGRTPGGANSKAVAAAIATAKSTTPREVHPRRAAGALLYVAAVYTDLVDLAWLEPQRATLLAWHTADPPSAQDVARSERVAAFQTGCAAGPCVNPFVADPTLAERAFAPRPTATDSAPDESVLALGPPRPNPSVGPVQFALTLSRRGHVRAVVLDALGRAVAVVHDGPAAGPLAVDASGLAPGVYALRVTAASETAVRRFTIVGTGR